MMGAELNSEISHCAMNSELIVVNIEVDLFIGFNLHVVQEFLPGIRISIADDVDYSKAHTFTLLVLVQIVIVFPLERMHFFRLGLLVREE
jgi:hypothetical protein